MKHYKIKPLDGNRGYYITTRQTFTSLQELVKGYQTTLCKVKLAFPFGSFPQLQVNMYFRDSAAN